MYIKNNRLHYVNSFVGAMEQHVVGDTDVPVGTNIILAASFEKADGPDPRICTGTMTLYHGDTAVGSIPLTTQAGKFSIAGEGLTVGRDSGAPVTDDYPGTEPWAFTGGTLHRVRVEVSGTPYIDLEREAQAMLMCQ